jgi:hypothetical protein
MPNEEEITNPLLEAKDTLDAVTFAHGDTFGSYSDYALAQATVALAEQQARTADALDLANMIAARHMGIFDTAEEYRAVAVKIRTLLGLPA